MMQAFKQLPVRLPPELKVWLEEQSRLNGSSQNSEVIRAIRAAMARSADCTQAA